MINLCKLRPCKKVLEILENSFLKNGILEFRSEALIVSFLTYCSNNYVHRPNMI